MAKIPSPYRFTYHERRVLGSIVYASEDPGFTLDRIDSRYTEKLIARKFITASVVELFGASTTVYSATELGKTTWYGWLKAKV